MNPKQTAPLLATLAPTIAAIAPQLIIGGAIGLGIVLLLDCLSSDDEEKKPETVPANEAESRRKAAETPAFRQIPAEIRPQPAAVPIPSAPRAAVPPPVVPTAPKFPTPAFVPAVAPQPTAKRKLIGREDMAKVFQRGAHGLTRTSAVAALKSLGFGKTAAYAALRLDGRFAPWLKYAPDGIITWKD